jgi:hypothetical protein
LHILQQKTSRLVRLMPQDRATKATQNPNARSENERRTETSRKMSATKLILLFARDRFCGQTRRPFIYRHMLVAIFALGSSSPRRLGHDAHKPETCVTLRLARTIC